MSHIWRPHPLPTAPSQDDTRLVGSWLNHRVSGAQDYSAYGNNGTPTAVTWERDGAGSFNGTTSAIVSVANSGLSGDVVATVAAWVFPTTLAGAYSGIVGFGNTGTDLNAMILASLSDGSWGIACAGGNNAFSAAGNLVLNEWQLLAITKSAGAINVTTTLYRNGSSVALAAGASAATPTVANAPYYLGQFGASPLSFFRQQVRDARVYNAILSASEIAEMFRLGVPDSSLALWIPYGDSDYSRYRRTLTKYGAPILGHRMSFDGTDDRLSAGDIGNCQEVSFWVNPGSTTEQLFRVDTGKSVAIAAGTITYTGLTASATYVNGVASTTLVASVWQHVVCQFTQDDANNFDLAYDGTNYGDVELYNVRVRDAKWSAGQVAIQYNQERGDL